MANSLMDLGKLLEEEVHVIRVKTSEVAKKIAIKVLDVATDNTVIDTTKAVSNWQVSLDSPKENPINAHFKGLDGSTAPQSKTVTKGLAVDVLRNKKPGQDIFITNNSFLDPDYGSSEEYIKNSKVVEAESEAFTLGITLAAAAEALSRDL